MERTRNCWNCPLFGSLCDLKDNILPTYEDVMKFYEWTRLKLKFERETKKEPTYKEIEGIVIAKLIEVWAKSSIPTVEPKRMKVMLQSYHLKCKKLLKSHPKIPTSKMEDFRHGSKVLFDVSACKCRDFFKCTCPKNKKIPAREHSFIVDQRSARKMVIGSIDVGITKQLTKSLKRKMLRGKSECKLIEDINTCTEGLRSTSESAYVQSDSEESTQIQMKTPNTETKNNVTMAVDYALLSKTCDRFRVSDRAGAAIASAILHASTSQVIDKNKLRRERKKTRDGITSQQNVLQIPALYFDGRKDQTLVIHEKDGKKYRRRILEEHISLIKEPDSKFIGYISPASGTAKCVEQEIYHYFSNSNTSIDHLIAIGCDGTNVNVGKYGGIIRMLEKRLNRPLQWIICLLHMNELPFRHLFQHIDGSTSGPQTFSGAIGKQLENCEKRSITQFAPIPTNLPELSVKISTDQNYLYRIVEAVSTGSFPSNLANKSPGKMSHARWLTRANRILRLYASVETPSENLITLATYVVKVYAPIWFSIKTHSSCKDGSRHFFKLIELTRYLPTPLKAIIDPVIQRNSYFAHPENVLLAMLTDSQRHIRELAARRILKARSESSPHPLRLFQLPNINFNATAYYDLLNWQDSYTEPPLLKSVTENNIRLFIEQRGEGELVLLRLPCHTQAVERAVKAVTEASATLCYKKSREGFIKAQIDSRKAMPKFDSKKDFHHT